MTEADGGRIWSRCVHFCVFLIVVIAYQTVSSSQEYQLILPFSDANDDCLGRLAAVVLARCSGPSVFTVDRPFRLSINNFVQGFWLLIHIP